MNYTKTHKQVHLTMFLYLMLFHQLTRWGKETLFHFHSFSIGGTFSINLGSVNSNVQIKTKIHEGCIQQLSKCHFQTADSNDLWDPWGIKCAMILQLNWVVLGRTISCIHMIPQSPFKTFWNFVDFAVSQVLRQKSHINVN